MDDLYHQEILDHYHNPDNFGKLDNPDQVIEETNASCGDSFTFYIKLKPKETLSGGDPERERRDSPGAGELEIEAVSFTGSGCAISTAASSMLSTYLVGKPVSEVEKLDLDFMQKLLGTTITPMRLKCLLLPAKALSQLLNR